MPNYSRLSMTGLPRGSAGRKGSKLPQKKAIKRRKICDEENRSDISSILAEPSNIEESSSAQPSNSTTSDQNDVQFMPATHVGDAAPSPGYHYNHYPYCSGDKTTTIHLITPFRIISIKYNDQSLAIAKTMIMMTRRIRH
jgi:hypothetical protein